MLTSWSAFCFANEISQEQCAAYVLYRESKGESNEVQRAVLDVVKNRSNKEKVSICNVVKKPGQFPYVIHGIKKVSPDWMNHYKEIDKLPKILDNDYMYFNNKKFRFGKNCKKIGGLVFCK